MKNLLTSIILLFSIVTFSQVEVIKIKTQRTFGRTIGYHLTIKNNSNKKIDAVEWTATFTDKFGDIKDIRKGEVCSSGNTITIDTSENIEPGKELQVTKSSLVKGATDVKIKVTRIHYIK